MVGKNDGNNQISTAIALNSTIAELLGVERLAGDVYLVPLDVLIKDKFNPPNYGIYNESTHTGPSTMSKSQTQSRVSGLSVHCPKTMMFFCWYLQSVGYITNFALEIPSGKTLNKV